MKDSSWRLLRGPPRIFKTSFGGLCGPQWTPTKGENAPSSLLPSAVDSRSRIHSFLQGIMGPEAFCTVNMRRFETSQKKLRKLHESGLRPSWGHPRPTSKLPKTCLKTPLKLQVFFEWRPDRCTHFSRLLRVASRRLRMQNCVFSKMLVFL